MQERQEKGDKQMKLAGWHCCGQPEIGSSMRKNIWVLGKERGGDGEGRGKG